MRLDPALTDAFIGMTRTTPGRGTMEFCTEDVVRLTYQDGAVEYDLLPEGGFRRRMA